MTAVRHTGGRKLRRLFLPLLLLASSTCTAQAIDPRDGRYALNEDGSVPPWVVPVLRLVSSTHVEPTTGLVLSDAGLVLVPLGFAAEEDEVIVLDGGTDIVRHGRPAHLKDWFPAEGLQVLSVPGLRRSPAPFADEALADGMRVELTAFPPAERIAEGDPPLHQAATLVVFGANASPAVSGETPLPNVTGPLLDACGNVVAYSLAHDVQTMTSHPGTRYRWRETLLAVLTRLGVTPASSACRSEQPAAVEPAPLEESDGPKPAEEATEATAEPEAEPPAAAEEADTTPAVQEPEPARETLDIERLPPIESGPPAPPDPEPRRAWPWLLLGLAAIAGGVVLHRLRRRGTESAGAEPEAADEADDEDGATDDAQAPPPGLDCRLLLRGVLADGTPVETGCAVSSRAINLVVGRGATADLVLPSAAVSRQHARLNGTAEALTVADLGSNNGTSVNGVPCLEGEILYLGSGDVLVLGDAQLSVHFDPREEGRA